MVSLWGSKKDDDQENGDDYQEEGAAQEEGNQAPPPKQKSSRKQPPNERTSLLRDDNPPVRRDGYLDPDDPAVSPYNLWTVRFLRYMTVLFAAVTFIWWVLLFVAIFVSPPGMNTRGSGFTDFSYTTLTLGNLMVALLFFAGPSKAVRVSMTIIAFLLLIDMIIILTVSRIRHEEGWVGIASVVWATVIAGWCVMTDRVVAWGKREEEERLTGRPESRRTLKEWLAVLVETVIVVVFIIIVTFMTATLVLRSIDAGVEMDGERYAVDNGKYNIHLACVGNVTTDPDTGARYPTVLIESGEVPSEYDFEHWAYAAVQNGTISRYCFWDRPGYAWSDDAPSPHSAGMSVDALSETLALAGERGPWISVSAGYGSIVARIFTARHVHDVKGLMMIDPLHEDLLHRIGAPMRGFELWGWGIISPMGIQRLIGAIFNGRSKEDRVYGRSVWHTGKFLKAKLQENLVADSLTRSEVSAANNIMSDKTPIVVISSGIAVGRDSEWERKQRESSRLTKRLVAWDVVNRAPHEVWRSLDGRRIMEKRVGELYSLAVKSS